MKINGTPPGGAEIEAFADRLNEIHTVVGRLDLIQIYTVARQPAESFVTALSEEQLNDISRTVESMTGLQTAVFPW